MDQPPISPLSKTSASSSSVSGVTISRKRRLRGRTDSRSLEVTLRISAVLVWLPYSLASLYVAYCNAFIWEERSGSEFPPASSSTSTVSRWSQVVTYPYYRYYYYIFPDKFDIVAYIPALIRVMCFSTAATACTYALAVCREHGGEYLMVTAWLLGVCSEFGWLVPTVRRHPFANKNSASSMTLPPTGVPVPPAWLWLVVSIISGSFSGILCKAKDIIDGKHDRDSHLFVLFNRGGRSSYTEVDALPCSVLDEEKANALLPHVVPRPRWRRQRHVVGFGERLYTMVPFWTGQWLCFLIKHGWRGIIVENAIIVLSLAMVGYSMLSYGLLKRHLRSATSRPGVSPVEPPQRTMLAGRGQGEATIVLEEELPSLDIIDLVSKLFTTSFGVVALVVVLLNVFVTTLAIPFLKALFSLNALVSSVGIIFELILYEAA